MNAASLPRTIELPDSWEFHPEFEKESHHPFVCWRNDRLYHIDFAEGWPDAEYPLYVSLEQTGEGYDHTVEIRKTGVQTYDEAVSLIESWAGEFAQ